MTFEKEIMEAGINNTLIPSYASLNEAVFYLLEDNERNFSNLIENIGLKELAFYESTGTVLLYEEKSEESQEAKKGTGNFITKAWANIRSLFERLLEQAKKLFEKVTSAIGGLVNKGSDAAKVSKAAGVTKKASYDDLLAAVDKIDDSFFESLKSTAWSYKSFGGSNLNQHDAYFDISKFVDAEAIKTNWRINEINPEEVKKKIRGDEEPINKQVVKNNFKAIYDSVTNNAAQTKEIKSFYGAAKVNFDKRLKDAKKAESNKEEIGKIKALIQASTVIYSAIISEYYAVLTRNAKIVLKANAVAKKGAKPAEEKKEEKKPEAKPEENKGGAEKVEGEVVDKDGNVVENANVADNAEQTVQESAIDSEIASLFDWSF